MASSFVIAYWKSFLLIAALCCALAYARNRLVRTKLRRTDVAMHAAFSAFLSLLLVMIVNAAGFDYGYWDEAIVSIAYVALGPPKFLRTQG